MAFLDGPSFFRNTLIPQVGGLPQTASRIPFTFTSTARLMKSGKLSALGNAFAADATDQRQKTQLALIEREGRGTALASQLGAQGLVDIARGVIQQGVGLDMPVIQMAVNPETVQWSQAKRITKKDTMGGSTYFHFSNELGQNNDILQCHFAGKTGNINTSVDYFDALATGANLKLRTWHELYNLSREGMLLTPQNTNKPDIQLGIPNQFFITYNTVLMPIKITLIGFFSQVLTFGEKASQQNMVDYSFGFTVTDTSPKLDALTDMLASGLTTIGAAKALGSDLSTATALNSITPDKSK